jgi:Zn-dependent alcohol dehydrogenase
VGRCGIQLAVNSGYHVITTCSSNNIEYCKSLGAEQAFDYKNPKVVDEITSFLSDKTLAGIMDSISKADTLKSCIEIARRTNGSKKISIVKPGAEKGQPDDVQMGSVVARISGKEVAKAIYGEFLPKALEARKMKPKPDPVMIGKGLEHMQEGMDKVRAGVRATKIVVSL